MITLYIQENNREMFKCVEHKITLQNLLHYKYLLKKLLLCFNRSFTLLLSWRIAVNNPFLSYKLLPMKRAITWEVIKPYHILALILIIEIDIGFLSLQTEKSGKALSTLKIDSKRKTKTKYWI